MQIAFRGIAPTALMATWMALAPTPSQGQTVFINTFDNLGSAAVGGYSSSISDTRFGSVLNLAQAGTLSRLGFSLYNHDQSGGNIVAGTMHLSVYDATGGYSGGPVQLPLLGSVDVSVDLSSQPLAPGFYTTYVSGDLASSNIPLSASILLVQRFEMTSGASTRWGIATGAASTLGSSPGTYFMENSQNPAGLYTGSGGAAVYPLYQVAVVPEPESFAVAAGIALLAWTTWRRKASR